MNIREEKETDIPYIRIILDQAFGGTDERDIVEDLRKNGNLTIALVCEIGHKIVGYIAYSPMYHKNKPIGLGLAPVAVLPEFQRQGIGSMLITAGNDTVISKGYSRIFVLGYPAYYAKFGFVPAKKYNYFSKFDPEGGHFMILDRNMNAEESRVDVEYGGEFDI